MNRIIQFYILTIGCLFFASCVTQKIEGSVRVIDEKGLPVSNVSSLQNTTILYRASLIPPHSDEDQRHIKINTGQSNKDGYISYSTVLYRPSMSYVLFYKKGYFPTLVKFDTIRTLENIVLVNCDSTDIKIDNWQMYKIEELMYSNASDCIRALEMGYDNSFYKYFDKSQLYRVYETIEDLRNSAVYFYSVSWKN